LFGFDGFDRLLGYVNSESRGDDYLDGGAGGDILSANAYGSSTLIGGDGNDYIESYGGLSFATGGADSDTFILVQTALTDHYNLTITDFEVGKDQIDLTPIVTYGLSQYSGGNPFKASLGFLRIRQTGSDTLIECDRDGLSGSGFDWQTIFRLNNLTADSLGQNNFSGGLVVGTASNDTLSGGWTNDTINGGGGSDSLAGGEGNDSLFSGTGNDYVDAGAGNDLIVGGDGAGDDTYLCGEGSDTLRYTSAVQTITRRRVKPRGLAQGWIALVT